MIDFLFLLIFVLYPGKCVTFYEPFNELTLMGRNLVRKDKKIEKEWIKQEIKSVHIGY